MNGMPPEVPRPSIGRIVIYRSRTGEYDLPAIVTATVDTLDPKGVELGHIDPLSSPFHVHLTVFTCGHPGTAREGNEVNQAQTSGTYQEFDVPLRLPDGATRPPAPGPGTWRWPERVG